MHSNDFENLNIRVLATRHYPPTFLSVFHKQPTKKKGNLCTIVSMQSLKSWAGSRPARWGYMCQASLACSISEATNTKSAGKKSGNFVS
jgi:hypothetical protein